ncbi:MAG TPA: hypothetical protein VFC67_24720 [Prolixibacteraceae bacterium]|nr:hypothetical protein [Prolixibacteraceae bacterium]
MEPTTGRIENQRISKLLPDVPERALQHCLKVSDVPERALQHCLEVSDVPGRALQHCLEVSDVFRIF